MIKFKKISHLFTGLLASMLIMVSCETTELELLDNPNAVTIEKADVDRFMSRIQLDFNNFNRTMGNFGAQLTRIEYMFGRQYQNVFEPANLNGVWQTAYAQMFSDIKAMETIAGEDFNNHVGVAKILQGITYIILVDNFGDVPFSQALDPVNFPAPVADPGAEVYAGAIALIDEGISLLSADNPTFENDFFFNNDISKWRKAGNTFKMYAYLNTGNTTEFNAIASNPSDHISSAADDFQFQYGTNETNPDTRHPAYAGGYTPQGVAGYRSIWLMGTMLDLDDPRRRYYFYRQDDCTPGASCSAPEPGPIPCSVIPKPIHLGDNYYCFLEDGYWGRDHGNNDGIPPDSFRRTGAGVYPYGGKFDGDNFEGVGVGVGAGGAGIHPIMLSSWVNFMKAEVALSGNGGNAVSELTNGISASVNKVLSFGSIDPDADASFFPSSGDVNTYVNNVTSAFNAASTEDKFEILATQLFIASYGNGNGAYNFYRRTGYPKSLQPNIEPNPGGFVRSHFYPANEANTNGNINQKLDVLQQVFWDTNPSSPGFPSAN